MPPSASTRESFLHVARLGGAKLVVQELLCTYPHHYDACEDVYAVSGVRVCVDREDGGLPGAVGVCGALSVCVGAPV